MPRKIKSFTVFLFLTSLMVSGCAQQTPRSDGGHNTEAALISYDAMQQEFKESTGKLAWPEGFQVPQKVEGEDSSAQYQKGYGDTKASMVYECAWTKEWLQSYSKDKQRAKKAISALEKVPNMEYMSKERADDATRRFFKDYLDRAKLGDPSGFQENATANCP